MRCLRVVRWLRSGSPAELASPPARVAAHLASCPACAAVHARQVELLSSFATLPVPAAPAELRGRVLSAVAAARPRPRLTWLPVAGLAAAAVLVALALQPLTAPRSFPAPAAGVTASGYGQQHAVTVSFDPLADATAYQAVGAVLLRDEVSGGRGMGDRR